MIRVFSSAMKIDGAGLSPDGNKRESVKQQGHFTSQQLKASNHRTKQVVHTNALHGSSNGWYRISRQIGHCSCSRMAGLLEQLTRTSGGRGEGSVVVQLL